MKSLLTFAVIAALLAVTVLAGNSQSINDAPHVIAAVAPATYPAIARAANAHGEVIIDVQVDAGGDVLSTKMISGHPLLQRVSEEAAKEWKFSPSVEGTKARTARLTFNFQTIDVGPKPKAEFTIIFLPPYKVDVREHARIVE